MSFVILPLCTLSTRPCIRVPGVWPSFTYLGDVLRGAAGANSSFLQEGRRVRPGRRGTAEHKQTNKQTK